MVRHHVRDFGHNKIVAIKIVRELSNLGLKDAKDIVEAYGSFVVIADAGTLARAAAEARRNNIVFDPPLDGSTPTLAGTGGSTAMPTGGHYAVRIVAAGPRLIAAIKLLRELTGLGLKEAKDRAEQGGLVRSGLSQGEAEAIARQFLEIEARVEVFESSAVGPVSLPPPSVKYDFEKEDDYDF